MQPLLKSEAGRKSELMRAGMSRPHRISITYNLGALIIIFCVILSGECLAISVTNTNDSGAGSLRAAILAAAAGDTIQFDSSLAGKTIKLTSGALEISKPLTIQGSGAGQLTVDGTHNGWNNVFEVDAGIRNVQISGLTIKGGGYYSPIANNSGYLSVAGCTLSGSGTLYTGGIYFDSTSGGSLTVNNCNLFNNYYGIYFWGSGGTAIVPVTITGCSISNNVYSGLYIGGGNINLNTSVQGCTISGNSDCGIYTVATLTVTDSTISGNKNCGVQTEYPGTTTLINSTVWGNTGGGTSNPWGTSLTLDNCTVSQNTSSSSGGGVYSYSSGAGTVTMNNTIVAYNSGSSGVDIEGPVTANYCLISDPTGATISGTANKIGTHAAPLDPQIAWLGAYGGPTMPDGTTMLTAPPFAGSPAIDAGSNVLIPSGLTTDQRGLPRITNGRVDIGACEYQPVVPSISISKQGTNVVLSWPTSATGFILMSSTNLGTAAVWGAVSPPAVVVNGQNVVTNSITGQRKFYRLMHP